MQSGYKIPHWRLKDVPIDHQCCIKHQSSRKRGACDAHENMNTRRSFCEKFRIPIFTGLLIMTVVAFFLAFVFYKRIVADSNWSSRGIDKSSEDVVFLAGNEPEGTGRQLSSGEPTARLIEDVFRDVRRNTYKLLSAEDRRRIRRDTATWSRDCQAKIRHCNNVLEAMQEFVEKVNSSMPFLQEHLKNSTRSKLMDLVECLECKYPGNVDDYADGNQYAAHEHSRGTHDVRTVKILLEGNRDKPKETRENSTNTNVTEDRPRSTVPEPTGTNATLDLRQHNKTKEWTSRVDLNAKNSSADVTDKAHQYSVTKITSKDELHPSTHPVDEGRKEKPRETLSNATAVQSNTTRNETKGARMAEGIDFSKIMTNKKDGYDGNPLTAPTAETIKSSQQLQLTPSMAWTPYPVCFFGYPPSGRGRQIFPGPSAYPASSPSAPFPMTGPQRRPFTNPAGQPSGSAVPNYVQVQAQSVQVMPYPGGLPQDVTRGLRFGPSGPGYLGYPAGVGFPTGGAGLSARSPYYCTYLPAPTFQYPTLPGAQNYQRNAKGNSESWPSENMIYTGVTINCPLGYRQCADGSNCIRKLKWCDGQVDCADASDETKCSCRDRISRDRLCDGYFDCPHGEDELGCFGCSVSAFSCGEFNNRQSMGHCVQLSERCDGVKQCPNGKDEMDCYILTPSYMEGKDVFTVGYTEGYLHRNFGGQWYPACAPTKSWAVEACASETGPDTSNDSPYMENLYVPGGNYLGPFLTETASGEVQVINSCNNVVVYVRCPRVRCGTRVLTNDESAVDFYSYENLRMGKPCKKDEEKDGKDVKTERRTDPPTTSGISEQVENGKNGQNDSIVGTELRVVGGHASQPKAWPFLVAIYRDGEFHCGGVILNQQWILTAAHCLDRYERYYYEVQAGMLRRYSFSPMAQTRRAIRVIRHSDYNKMAMTHDIGMMMLDQPLGFNRWVRPVCLPEAQTAGPMWRSGPPADSTCIAIGWGATMEHGPNPDHLREVEVPILPSCKHLVDQNEAEICAGIPQGGRDACQGDSGGPLMCRNPNYPSQWYVAGIVSHGEGCGQPDEPGAYTKVSYFVNWIQGVAQGVMPSSIENVPLSKCPGFSCEGGLGKCLPAGKRCDLNVDCLDGEDEINCSGYTSQAIFRKSNSSVHEKLRESTHEKLRESVHEKFEESTDDASVAISSTVTPKSISTTETLETRVTPNLNLTTITQTTENEIQINSTTTKSVTTEDVKTVTISPTTMKPVHAFFTCTKLLQRVFIEKRCDKVFDCEDGTDENNCTCKDYLTRLHPNAICNGLVDCKDRSDEENCALCSEEEFLCKRSGKCISKSKKCDSEIDCPLGEDEEDCYTLSNGMSVNLDADGRPLLNLEGIFTAYDANKWHPACHEPYEYNNEPTELTIGQNMCGYFGYARLQSAVSVFVRMASLPTNSSSWKTRDDYLTPYVMPSSEEKTCLGLYVRCRPVLNSKADVHLVVDPRTGSRAYRWPWSAAIFVDGRYRCTAILLEPEWLLSATKCIADVGLLNNYTVAVLGTSAIYRDIEGPYQQTSIVDDVKFVKDSNASLLHLRTAMISTRYVQPLYLERKIFPPLNGDYCVAIGTDERSETKSIFLRPVLKDCEKCHRCFINDSIPECENNNHTSFDWSGVIVCHGLGGWYPAAVFDEKDGFCSFRNVKSLPSIDYINAHMMKAMEEKLRPYEEPVCHGFRCSIGECISRDKVCNGIKDCPDGMDEDSQFCENSKADCLNDVEGCRCARSELRCGNGNCVPKSAFCNGNFDCTDQSDEPKKCSCAEYLKLTAPERICDGVWHCLDKSDESPEMCHCKNFNFKCNVTTGNETCIPQDFVCDGHEDCPGGDDEMECRKIKSSPNDPPGTGEIIRRSYGVWHSECFPTPTKSPEEISTICKDLGFVSGNFTRVDGASEKPLVPLRDNFYVVRLNSETWVTMRDDKPLIKLVEPNDTCHRLYVSCS